MSTGIGIGIAGDTFQTRAGLASGGGGGSLLLDLYGADAYGAYSLRKLSSTYTGSAVRVRRVSDNTETDIGFDANGDLDTLDLLLFYGSGLNTVLVVKWYDQSGNSRDAVSVLTTTQPTIAQFDLGVGGPALITENGKPSMTGSTALAIPNPSATVGQPITFFSVYAQNGIVNPSFAQILFTSRTGAFRPTGGIQSFILSNNLRQQTIGNFGDKTYVQTIDNSLHVLTSLFNGSNSTSRIDQTVPLLSSGSDPSPLEGISSAANYTGIGLQSPLATTFFGRYSELIIYSADKTSDFTGIETDMKNYYSTP
jgi:hypothetical protein